MRPSFPQKILFKIVFFAAPLLVYALLLFLQIPSAFSHFFSFYSVILFILILALYLAGFSLPGRWRWLAVSCLTMGLFALALSYKWTSGYSDAAMIGGILPYKDSYFYYNGARFILIGQVLPGYSMQAAWRPLFPGFLSSLLLFTRQNLQVTLAILLGLVGFCIFLSGEKIYRAMGRLSAAIYMTLLYLYMQPLIGYPLTESLGLATGCLGLVLLWEAAHSRKMNFLLGGLVVLMAAVSIRAGTFLIFPLLIVWAGWVFRSEKRFAWRAAGIAAAVVLASFLLFNTVYARLMVKSEAATFGNFAYTIYGQVMGGTGWTYGFLDTATTDPAVIYQAAWQEFLQHPWSLAIAVVKSYRDFLFPNVHGIFSFLTPGERTWLDILLWVAGLGLLLWGALRALREIKSPLSSLLVFAVTGFLLSIPFLPPIDGGRRFYASSVPIFFALLANAVGKMRSEEQEAAGDRGKLLMRCSVAIATLVLVLTAFVPVITLRLSRTPPVTTPVCPTEQVPFAVRVNPGSYIDLVPDAGATCGFVPQICMRDFLANGTEKDIDDFYQLLLGLVQGSITSTRVMPANDLVSGGFHFYVGDSGLLGGDDTPRVVSGCATEVTSRYQNIYKIETVAINGS